MATNGPSYSNSSLLVQRELANQSIWNVDEISEARRGNC